MQTAFDPTAQSRQTHQLPAALSRRLRDIVCKFVRVTNAISQMRQARLFITQSPTLMRTMRTSFWDSRLELSNDTQLGHTGQRLAEVAASGTDRCFVFASTEMLDRASSFCTGDLGQRAIWLPLRADHRGRTTSSNRSSEAAEASASRWPGTWRTCT